MKKRILLADDDPGIKRHVQHLLEQAGFECHAVNNGQEAIQAFSSISFDGIVLDGEMPKCDGFGAIRRIRDIERQKRMSRTPALLFSAMTPSKASDLCQEAGFDAYLPKYRSYEVSRCLRHILKNSKSRTFL
jgi:CheY-like chemotaxis protein